MYSLIQLTTTLLRLPILCQTAITAHTDSDHKPSSTLLVNIPPESPNEKTTCLHNYLRLTSFLELSLGRNSNWSIKTGSYVGPWYWYLLLPDVFE